MSAGAHVEGLYDGLNQKLLEAIPATAKRVLELGCANGRLGRRFKELHPQAQWWGVDISRQATATAKAHLDRVFTIDLDTANLTAVGKGFDVIVIGDLLQHLKRPESLLNALYDLSAGGAQIVCCLPNMAHASVIERLLAGDISYDGSGLMDQTHLRFFSQASAFKTFLDTGWLPSLHDQYRDEMVHSPFAVRLLEAAMALGLPRETALRNLGMSQMVLVCRKWPMAFLAKKADTVPFSVIVPVNRAWQYNLNIARSPGLQEVGAEVVVVQDARNAAEAYATGAARARHAWRVMVHQDVYFPVGSGFALAQKLAALTQAGHTDAPVGFAGLEDEATPDHATDDAGEVGMVIDRDQLFSHPASSGAVSVDEFAVAMHRDCRVQIDPALGWHLWATDLCLQAQQHAGRSAVPVLQVPLYHNSTNDFGLPQSWHDSANRVLLKYPQRHRIATLCGDLVRKTGYARRVAGSLPVPDTETA